MFAPLSQRSYKPINLDNVFFFSPTTPGKPQQSTLSHLLPSHQLPSLPPVPPSHSLPSSTTQHLPPKPPTLPQKPVHSIHHHSPKDRTISLCLPPPPSLKSAPTSPLFPRGRFGRTTHELLSTPSCIPLPHATNADTLTARVTTALPKARPPIDSHGAGYPDVGLPPQHVRLRTHDSPNFTRHSSEPRQGPTICQPPCNPGNDQSSLSHVSVVTNVSKSPIPPSPNPTLGNPAPTSYSNSVFLRDPLPPRPALQVKIPETTRSNTPVLANPNRTTDQLLERIAKDPGNSNAHSPPEEQVQAMQPSTLPSGIDKTAIIGRPDVEVAADQDRQSSSSHYSQNINSAPSKARKNVSEQTLPSLEGSGVATSSKPSTANRLLACRDNDYDEHTHCRKRCQSVAGIDSRTSDRGAARTELKHATRSSCPPRSLGGDSGTTYHIPYQPDESQQSYAEFKEFPIHQAILKYVRIGERKTFCVTGRCEETSLPYLAPHTTDRSRIELSLATFDIISKKAGKRRKLSSRKPRTGRLSANGPRKSWTSSEDSTIVTLKQRNAGWPEIFKALPDRTEAAIRARYFSKLAKLTGPTTEDQDEFEVEALLARRKGSKNEYLVQWKGYPQEENSWVEQDDISTELVIEFERNHAMHGGLFSGIRLLEQDHHGSDEAKYLIEFQGRPSQENMWLHNSEVSDKLIAEFDKIHRER
ncbi:hypothetical protein FPOA_06962 [Fusarium poae]|nr:hypothetical protein FPOA_06962 [Fusarium poae]